MKQGFFVLSAIAAASLCAAIVPGSAFAQSGVTLYGIVDASVGVSSAGGTAGRIYRLDSGAAQGSRWGLRGNEDLGGGMRASFQLEQGFAVDTGVIQQGGAGFGRTAWVGLSLRDWTVSLGRQYSPTAISQLAVDTFAGSYWGNTQGIGNGSVSAAVAGEGGHQATYRVNNSVLVTTRVGAITARAMLAAGDENERGSGRLAALGLYYTTNTLTVAASGTRVRQYSREITASATPAWQTEVLAGAAYDFGAFKLFAGYYSFDPSEDGLASALTPLSTLKTKSYWLGTRVPIGPGLLLAQVMASRFEHIAGVSDGKGTTLGIAYDYPLSKRTTVYVSHGRVSNNDTSRQALYGGTTVVTPTSAGANPLATSLGLRHSF